MGQDMRGYAEAEARRAQDTELREARIAIDRLKVEKAQLVERIGRLEQEAEALRDMVARVTRGGAGAVL